MLVSREELRFDFKGASFDLRSEKDLKLLGWIFNQFLYGEVTGIQCGYWLYRAPHLNAAAFLAKQAGEEISHVRRVLRVLSLLGQTPSQASRAIQFLSTGMMGGTWAEHVILEMALGEGLVLGVFYAMADTLDHEEVKRILIQASAEEEKHVEFGEREALIVLEKYPEMTSFLKTLAWIQYLGLNYLKKAILRKINQEGLGTHPVFSQFEAFYDHTLRTFELRIRRLGLCESSFSEIRLFERVIRVIQLPFQMILYRLKYRTPLLNESYLDDPVIHAEVHRSSPS